LTAWASGSGLWSAWSSSSLGEALADYPEAHIAMASLILIALIRYVPRAAVGFDPAGHILTVQGDCTRAAARRPTSPAP
jgi:hypothetical protein